MTATAAPFVCFSGIAPNTGDTAIGQAIVQGLKRRLDYPIRLHSNKPDVFAALPEVAEVDAVMSRLPSLNPTSLPMRVLPFAAQALVRDLRQTGGSRRLPREAFQDLRDCLQGAAGVIFQGGPNWNDRIVTRRFALERRLFLEAARFYGPPVYEVGVSCGPFAWSGATRLRMAPLCRLALDGYERLFVRDAFSRPALHSLGVRTPVVESTDAAVFLDAAPDPRYAEVEAKIQASRRRRLVVCTRAFQPVYTDAVGRSGEVTETLASVLDQVQARWADVFFLSTDHTARPEKATDVEVAHQVVHKMRVPGAMVVETHVRNPAGLKFLYGLFDAMLTMRLHPAILALGAGVPAIALAYDQKCHDFFAQLDLSADAVALSDFTRCPPLDRLAAMLHGPDVRRDVSARFAALRTAHMHDYEVMYEQIERRATTLASGSRRSTTRALLGSRVS